MRAEPVAAYDLMERAVTGLARAVCRHYPPERHPVLLLCGPGNNGGDGLGLARHLADAHYRVVVWQTGTSKTPEHARNAALLADRPDIRVYHWPDLPPSPGAQTLVIDALLGSGFEGPLRQPYTAIIDWVAVRPGLRISVDLPTGMPARGGARGMVFPAAHILTLEFPKASFFMAAHAAWCRRWEIVPLGLHPDFPDRDVSREWLVEAADIRERLRPPHPFDHKGSRGHALLIAGATGSYGAARLAAEACLRAGCGKLTVHLPRRGLQVMQTAFPEAMVQMDAHDDFWTSPPDTRAYQAIGVGPGIGTHPASAEALSQCLSLTEAPLVLDADALNLLAQYPEMWSLVPRESILTPHPGELRRLFGASADETAQQEMLRQACRVHGCLILLKGAFTRIAHPDGRLWINPTGNAGMATAGSGDVLTGILTGLLAQGYTPEDAALTGVYLHGLAGDLALAAAGSPESVTASDLIHHIGHAFNAIRHGQPA